MGSKQIFTKTEILTPLAILDRGYNKASKVPSSRNNQLLKIYSKIAVITAGGWIEDGMKSLVEISAIKLRDNNGQCRLRGDVEFIFGFSYKQHFSKALMFAFGAHGLEYIEDEIGATDLVVLESSLGNLKSWRDHAAHSYSVIISATPTRVIGEMSKIIPILKKIEKSTKKYRDIHF